MIVTVRKALPSLGCTHLTYKVEAWPTIFLLDKQGRIRWMHVGEGDYDEAERLIQKLLTEKES